VTLAASEAQHLWNRTTCVFFAVQEFVRAGVAGLQIEDQEAPKKSATMAGRRVITVDEAVGKNGGRWEHACATVVSTLQPIDHQ
jgi:isocitrate lyase